MKKRKKRKELDYKTRLAIAKYLNDGLNIIQISKILGRDDAVLYREVNKRSVDGVYNPLLAEEDAIKSRSISDEQVAKRRVSCYKVSAQKVLIIVKNLDIMKLILFGVLDHQHIAC